jgi:arsenate reductase (thioredoxin)
MSRKSVLFLCTGNSCRSQMAEGLVNHFLASGWQAYSAGTRPSGYVHPLAIEAMAELGIDISAGQSKSTETFRQAKFDVVVTVCDNAAEDCPLWLGPGRVVHISFPDPAGATGSHKEKMVVFRQVRDDIRGQVLPYLAEEAAEG